MKMQLPPGATSLSMRGLDVEPDEENCIEVPMDLVEEMQGHGLVPYAPSDVSKKRKV